MHIEFQFIHSTLIIIIFVFVVIGFHIKWALQPFETNKCSVDNFALFIYGGTGMWN